VYLDSTLYKNTPATKNKWVQVHPGSAYAPSLNNNERVSINTAWVCGAEWGYACIDGSYKHTVEVQMISPGVQFPATPNCSGGLGENECLSWHEYSFA
jgi:hypothetical protein